MKAAAPTTLDTVPEHVPDDLVVDFDVYNPAKEAEGFHKGFVDFQRATQSPIVWSTRNGGHWIAVRGPEVYDLYADHPRFSSKYYFVPASAEQGFMGAFTLDPPEHQPFRAFLNRGFSAEFVKPEKSFARELASELVDDLVDRGACNFITDFADILPLTVFLHLVGLPFEDREQLGCWAEAATRASDPDDRLAALNSIAEYLQPHIQQRRANPSDDLLSIAVNADIDGRLITDEEATGAAIHLMGAGLDTVSSMFSFVMLFLAQNPEHRRELAADPQLIDKAAMELIRRFPTVTMARRVREDIHFHGVRLKEGDMLALPTAFYNLDEEVYERPLTVDWERRVRRILTFGNGPHRCPGAALGRAELVIMLQEWLKRIPDFEVAPNAQLPVAGGTVAKVLNLPLVWR